MIVHTQHGRVVVTDHALTRYVQRVDRRASPADLARSLMAAELAGQPSWVSLASEHLHRADGWFIGEGWAMPVRRSNATDRNPGDFDFVAVTCMSKRRRSKADVRAWRERRAEAEDDFRWAS